VSPAGAVPVLMDAGFVRPVGEDAIRSCGMLGVLKMCSFPYHFRGHNAPDIDIKTLLNGLACVIDVEAPSTSKLRRPAHPRAISWPMTALICSDLIAQCREREHLLLRLPACLVGLEAKELVL
jgi:hypothetical protein